MDGSVVNVALPTLQARFGATSSGIQWVVQSYALFGAALLLLASVIDMDGDAPTYGESCSSPWHRLRALPGFLICLRYSPKTRA
jgi:hypothetical protein